MAGLTGLLGVLASVFQKTFLAVQQLCDSAGWSSFFFYPSQLRLQNCIQTEKNSSSLSGSPLVLHLQRDKPVSQAPGMGTAFPPLPVFSLLYPASWHDLEDVLLNNTPSRDGSYPHQLTSVLISCKMPQNKEEGSF